jgi:hypothetical protein
MDVFPANLQDPDLATAETVQTMCAHIHRAAADPLVQRVASQAESAWGNATPSALALTALGSGTAAPAGPGCFWWAKHFCRALPHSQFKALLAAYPAKRQLLISPEVLLRTERPAGDCSTFAMLIAAMLEALDARWELVTVAADPADAANYSHVFVRAVLEDGSRLTLDGSHGKYPGWEVPLVHQFRRQVWDSDGQPITDQAPRVSALGAYRPRPRGGFGQLDSGDDGSGGDGSTTTITIPGISATTPGYDPSYGVIDLGVLPGGTMTVSPASSSTTNLSSLFASEGLSVPSTGTASSGGYVAPSGGTNTAAWAAFATALSKSGMTLAEINAIQPGTVVSANGSILRQATGFAVPGTTALTSLSSSGSTMLLLGGLALVVLFMVMGGRR